MKASGWLRAAMAPLSQRIPDRSWIIRRCFFAIIVTVAIIGMPRPVAWQPYTFEAVFESSVDGHARLYFHRGEGLREEDSVGQPVRVGENVFRVPLPAAKFNTFRLDPIDRPGTVVLRETRVLAPAGWIERRFSLNQWRFNDQFDRRSQAGSDFSFVASPDADDPYLWINFEPRLSLPFRFIDRVIAAWWVAPLLFGGVLVCLVLAENGWRRRDHFAVRAREFARSRPRTAIALFSGLSAILSAYPVVFFGMSFVSPNTGSILLYDARPTVPGQTDLRVEEARGSDVGAMMWQHLPYTILQARALREGTIPLWNRYNSSGITLLGQGQSMLGDPLQLLVAAAGGGTWALDAKFVLCKALFACGIGWSVWLLTRDVYAAGLASFASVFIAFFNYRINHPAIFSVCYSPWVLVAWLELWRATSRRQLRRSVLLWIFANCLLLASGTVKEAYLLFAGLNGTAALAFLISSLEFREKLRRASLLLIAGVAMAAITAPLWWTFLDTLASSYTAYDTPRAFQIRRDWLIGFFDDLFYLELHPQRLTYAPAGNFLVLMGCLWGVARIHQAWLERMPLALLLGMIVAFAIAFEWVPGAWVIVIPFLKNIHHVGIHSSCVALVLALVFAGWGFADARRKLGSGRIRLPLILAALMFCAMLGCYFTNDPALWTGGRGLAGFIELLPTRGFFFSQVILLPVACAIILWLAVRYARGRRVTIAQGIFGAAALIVIVMRHGQHLPLPLDPSFFRMPGPRVDVTAASPATDLLKSQASQAWRVGGIHHTLQAGFTLVYDLESMNGPDALVPRHYRELLDAAHLVAPHDWHVLLTPEQLRAWRPMLDFFNVRYVAALPGTSLERSGLRRIAELDLDIHESDTAWPRAYFVDQLRLYRDAADLAAQVHKQRPGAPFAAVQEGDPAAPRGDPKAPLQTEPIATPADGYELVINATSFRVTAPRPGFAVLHESWSPGDFRVQVNGEDAPYFRVNHAFKAVELPSAGTYQITFRYWPRHLTQSLWLAAGGLVIVGFLYWHLRPLDAEKVRSLDISM